MTLPSSAAAGRSLRLNRIHAKIATIVIGAYRNRDPPGENRKPENPSTDIWGLNPTCNGLPKRHALKVIHAASAIRTGGRKRRNRRAKSVREGEVAAIQTVRGAMRTMNSWRVMM